MRCELKCELCGRGMKDGVDFHRQNEKGVKGIWRCGTCNELPFDPVIKAIIDALNGGKGAR